MSQEPKAMPRYPPLQIQPARPTYILTWIICFLLLVCVVAAATFFLNARMQNSTYNDTLILMDTAEEEEAIDELIQSEVTDFTLIIVIISLCSAVLFILTILTIYVCYSAYKAKTHELADVGVQPRDIQNVDVGTLTSEVPVEDGNRRWMPFLHRILK